ncbi:hypothetical protein HDU76_007326, partial [Blyttiomyces sp. JEL0837]
GRRLESVPSGSVKVFPGTHALPAKQRRLEESSDSTISKSQPMPLEDATKENSLTTTASPSTTTITNVLVSKSTTTRTNDVLNSILDILPPDDRSYFVDKFPGCIAFYYIRYQHLQFLKNGSTKLPSSFEDVLTIDFEIENHNHHNLLEEFWIDHYESQRSTFTEDFSLEECNDYLRTIALRIGSSTFYSVNGWCAVKALVEGSGKRVPTRLEMHRGSDKYLLRVYKDAFGDLQVKEMFGYGKKRLNTYKELDCGRSYSLISSFETLGLSKQRFLPEGSVGS